MLYTSMMFRLKGNDPEKTGDAWQTIPALMEKAEAAGTHRFPRKTAIVRPQRSAIEWRVEFSPPAREGGTAGKRGLPPPKTERGKENRQQDASGVRKPPPGGGVLKK